jgi:glyoxylase-like metal-dependent hydrolase (beta-lactamase superfamily II)
MKTRSLLFATAALCAALSSASAEVTKDYATGTPAAGSIRFRWNHGSVAAALNRDPRVQVQAYNEDTFLMRQNIAIDFEAPFMYLLMGNDGALLIDTGATANAKYFPIRTTVDSIIKRWCGTRGKTDIPLTVVLTSPEDLAQNQGYQQFVGRPNTKLAPLTLAESKAFYGLADTWPKENGKLDLGGRIITVIPTPGTHKDGLTFYDPYNQFLYTGDFLYPGRVLIGNDRDYLASITKLKAFAAASPVKWILGGHIEMTNMPGVDYPRRTNYKPNERLLQLEPAVIAEAATYAQQIMGKSDALIRADFVLMNRVGPGTRSLTRPPDLAQVQTAAGTGLR